MADPQLHRPPSTEDFANYIRPHPCRRRDDVFPGMSVPLPPQMVIRPHRLAGGGDPSPTSVT